MMHGGPIVPVEKRGKYELCCYGSPRFAGGAIFKDDRCIINGRWSDIWKKYVAEYLPICDK